MRMDTMVDHKDYIGIKGIGKDRIEGFSFSGKILPSEIEFDKKYDRGPHKDVKLHYTGKKDVDIFAGLCQRSTPHGTSFSNWYMAPVEVVREKLRKKDGFNAFELSLLSSHLEVLQKDVASMRYYSKPKPFVPVATEDKD